MALFIYKEGIDFFEGMQHHNFIPINIAERIPVKTAHDIDIEIQKEFGSFSDYIWGFTNNQVVKNSSDVLPVSTPLSDKISKDLKKRGMKYVGTIIIYSYLQAIGVVDDHEKDCFKY